MSVHEHELVIIDVWAVPAGHEQEMIDRLLCALGEFRSIDGFVEAGVLRNRRRTKVAWYLRMRSAEIAECGEVRRRILALESLGGSQIDAFERVSVIVPSPESGPTEVSYGAL